MSVMADVVVLTMAEDTLKASFEEIDTSGNGELDWSELKAWLELINAGSITDDDAKLMIEEADTDHNGECDFNEVRRACTCTPVVCTVVCTFPGLCGILLDVHRRVYFTYDGEYHYQYTNTHTDSRTCDDCCISNRNL